MSLSTQDFTLAKRRFNQNAAQNSALKQMSVAFFTWLAGQKGHPNLQVVEFDNLTGSDTVIADTACRLFAIILKKATTTAAYFKGSDSATTSSSTAPEIEFRQNSVTSDAMFFPKGNDMANGFTVSSDTTSDGNTTSAAGDGASGVVLLGAAGA